MDSLPIPFKLTGRVDNLVSKPASVEDKVSAITYQGGLGVDAHRHPVLYQGGSFCIKPQISSLQECSIFH